jgi:hypothetical protein
MLGKLRVYDLQTLEALANSLEGISGDAEIMKAQERATLIEWMNFKARLNNPKEVREGSQRDGALTRHNKLNYMYAPDGFLDIRVTMNKQIGKDAVPNFWKMGLGDAEPSVKEFFKNSGMTVRDARVNSIVRVNVQTGSEKDMILHRRPDTGRISVENCSSGGLAFLKAYQAGKYYREGFRFMDFQEINTLNMIYKERHAVEAATRIYEAILDTPLSKISKI